MGPEVAVLEKTAVILFFLQILQYQQDLSSSTRFTGVY
jgi:hypothetical protein